MSNAIGKIIIAMAVIATMGCQRAPLEASFDRDAERVIGEMAQRIETARSFSSIKRGRGFTDDMSLQSNLTLASPTINGSYDDDLMYEVQDCDDHINFMPIHPANYLPAMAVMTQCLDRVLIQKGMALTDTFDRLSEQARANLLFLTDWRGDGKRKGKKRDWFVSFGLFDGLFGESSQEVE